jgi:hypothetical protein
MSIKNLSVTTSSVAKYVRGGGRGQALPPPPIVEVVTLNMMKFRIKTVSKMTLTKITIRIMSLSMMILGCSAYWNPEF